MSPDLDDKLANKYPEIFEWMIVEIDGKKHISIGCSDGWYAIIDKLCHLIQFHVNQKNLPPVKAMQVKEKFGGLRFYVNHSDDYINGVIDMAAGMSYITCEYCGKPGTPNKGGWITTLCKGCRRKDNALRK